VIVTYCEDRIFLNIDYTCKEVVVLNYFVLHKSESVEADGNFGICLGLCCLLKVSNIEEISKMSFMIFYIYFIPWMLQLTFNY
jgi:hypothetical protein